jgi:hypothetical protein
MWTLLIFVVADLANRAFFTYIFANPPQHSKMRSDLSYVLNEEQSDILILGASTASHHYNTQMIMDSLGKTCYNAGQDGQPIYNQYLNLLRALQNGKVEAVILNLGHSQIKDPWMSERVYPLTPYYWKNDTVRNVVDDVSKCGVYSKYLYLSSFLQFNSQTHVVLEYIQSRYENQKHGYVPLPYTGKPCTLRPSESEGQEGFVIHDKALPYLLKIKSVCEENHTKLYIVLCPSLVYKSMHEYREFIKDFCHKHDISLFDYTDSKDFVKNPYLWKDLVHMNERGADAFTNVVIHDVLMN